MERRAWRGHDPFIRMKIVSQTIIILKEGELVEEKKDSSTTELENWREEVIAVGYIKILL